MFEKKRGKRFLASVMALVMLLSLAPVGALAAETAETTNTFEATAYTDKLTASSPNEKTQAYAMWKDADAKYYLAIASKTGQNKVDEDFKNEVSGKFSNTAYYIENDQGLTVKLGEESKIDDVKPSEAAKQQSDTWVILVMTPKELKEKLHYNNSNGTFNLGIDAGGFNIGNITITDETFKGTVDGDVNVNPPEQSEPSTQYERLYVTILTGTTFPNEPGFSHKHGYDFVKQSDNGYSIEAYDQTSYSSNQQVFSTQAGNFIKVSDFNAADLTTNGNVKGLYNANGIDLTEYTNFTEENANAIAAAYASYKNLDTSATYKLVPYVLKYENHGSGPDFPSTGYHLDCIVVKNETVLVKYDINGATTSNFQLPDNTYVTLGESVTIGSWKDSSGTTVAGNNITAQKDGKDVTFVGWSTKQNESPNSEGLYQADSELQNVTRETTLYAIWEKKEDTAQPDLPPAPPRLVTAKFFINLGGKDASNREGIGEFTGAITIDNALNYTLFEQKRSKDMTSNNGYIFEKNGVKTVEGCEGNNLLRIEPRDDQINSALSAANRPDLSVGEGNRYVVWYHVSDCGNDGYHVDGYIKNAAIQITYNPNQGSFDTTVEVDSSGNHNVDGISGTTYNIIQETPTRDGYTFIGWKLDNKGTLYKSGDPIIPTGDVTLVAQWEQNYTVIFNANGGTWAENVTIPDYNINEGTRDKATRENLTASDTIKNITYPTKNGATMIGWGTQKGNPLYQLGLGSGVAVSNLKSLNGVSVTGNTITLYAIWEDVSADQRTYTIHQHFMKDASHEDGAINYYTTSQVASVGTPISSLIPNELIDTSKYYNFNGSKYLYEAAKIGTAPYTGQETLQADNTEIHLYYYLDSLNDADKDGTSTDKDSLTGGDGIPDYKQILIQYQVYQEGNGQVSPTFEVVTVKDNKELTEIHGSSVEKAGTGYTFVTWTGQNVAVTDVGDIIDETNAEKLKNLKCDPSGDTFKQGESYTYTAIFLEDKIGGGENKDQPDGTPDRYQVTINYVTDNTGRGQITGLTKEVKTIYENGTDGKWASTGKVTATGSTAEATGSRNYFSNWANDAGLPTSSTAKLGKQTFNAKGGETYTFTANFYHRSGGGGSRPSTPTVTIPDNVPTGLNGTDHYAYIIGYGNNDVRPQNNITRAEVATIFFRLLTDETREANMTKSNSYNDVKDGDWFCCAVSTLSKMGIIKGYEDGSFKPNDPISRAEFAAIAARFDPDGDKTPASFSDVTSHWAKDEISIAANHGWIKGYEDGSFKPDQKITRAETMTLVNRVLNRLPETKDDLHKDMKTWVDNMDETAWYYLAVQEATNSHYFKNKTSTKFEQWTDLRDTRDWSELEK